MGAHYIRFRARVSTLWWQYYISTISTVTSVQFNVTKKILSRQYVKLSGVTLQITSKANASNAKDCKGLGIQDGLSQGRGG